MSDENQKNDGSWPVQQASRGGRNGNVPPAQTRFQPGQRGNPRGRPSAGSSVREEINRMAHEGATEADLLREARDPKNTWERRAAAERMLRCLEFSDIADFADLLSGKVTVEQLRATGVDTSVIRRFRRRSYSTTGADGTRQTITSAVIEFHDRAGDEFDRIVNQTAGMPTIPIQMDGQGNVEIQGWMAMLATHNHD
jgi:hypothetical protein